MGFYKGLNCEGTDVKVRENMNSHAANGVSTVPNRQNCRKSSAEECILDYMALHIEC